MMNSVPKSWETETHRPSLLLALPCALLYEAKEIPGVEVNQVTENPYYSCAVTDFAYSLTNKNTEKKIFVTSKT